VKTVAVLAVLAGSFATVAAAGDYRGKAQALMPTPGQIGFKQLLQFKPAKKPGAKLAGGWQQGVAAIYAKGTAKAPIDAAATVYVYANAAAATTALQYACPKCARVPGKGVQMRASVGKSNGTTVVQAFTACHNVYVNALTTGSETTTKLATDAGVIALAVYRRATHFGMSACN
jgi:hypothetical protein